MSDYIIKEVIPKKTRRYIHMEVEGRPCYILDLEIGRRALIKFEPDYDPGCYHRLHTSVVENYTVSDGERSVTIETQNTIYILETSEDADDTFNGVQTFTIDTARDDIAFYLSERPDDYFTSGGMTKEEALQDDVLLEKIAQEHYHAVVCSYLERNWSCHEVCDANIRKTA